MRDQEEYRLKAAEAEQRIKVVLITFLTVNYCKTVIALTLLHSEQPKLHGVWAVLSAIGLSTTKICYDYDIVAKVKGKHLVNYFFPGQGILAILG